MLVAPLGCWWHRGHPRRSPRVVGHGEMENIARFPFFGLNLHPQTGPGGAACTRPGQLFQLLPFGLGEPLISGRHPGLGLGVAPGDSGEARPGPAFPMGKGPRGQRGTGFGAPRVLCRAGSRVPRESFPAWFLLG